MKVFMKSPQGDEIKEVEATAAALSPLMSAGCIKCPRRRASSRRAGRGGKVAMAIKRPIFPHFSGGLKRSSSAAMVRRRLSRRCSFRQAF